MFPVTRRSFLGSMAALPLMSQSRLLAEKPMGKTAMQTIAEANNAFAANLHQNLAAKPGNVFFSPYSIESALAMTAQGAKGKTLAEMQKALNLPAKMGNGFRELTIAINGESGKERGFQLSVANALWGQRGFPFREEYIGVVEKDFGAVLRTVDFSQADQARNQINQWVEQQTHDRIKDLIPKNVLSALTRLVLTNAIYFKGTWEKEFKKEATKELPFHLANGKKQDTPMMAKNGMMPYTETDLFQAIELPYKGKETSMVVLLPKKANELGKVEASLSAESWSQLTTALQRRSDVRLQLPKFKLETEYSLNQPMKDLGIKDAFGAGADFRGMHTSAEELYISDIVHKAFVEVNEEGTEAAAATGVIMATKSAAIPQEPKVFKADHPFLFAIRHVPSNTILFLGRLEEPKQ